MRRATSSKRATQRLRRTVKKPLDMKTHDKLRKALRAKCGSRPDERFFRKYDRDRSGELSVQEVEEMFRTGLKITSARPRRPMYEHWSRRWTPTGPELCLSRS